MTATDTPIYASMQAGLARKNDRLTSVLAAEQVTDVNGTRRAVLEILRELGPLPDDYIHREHTHLARLGIVPRRLSPQRIRTVRAQLVDDGLVDDSGEMVRLDGARCASTIWKAVE
ncbi:hypothetical protein Y09_1374 [Brachybacterium sp. SW0106-09]|uniref:hypothetical protein n=1 Tax=Brachybacterium sp. SW0106-09 TaxID=1704590 RepID=UPI0006B6112A|nr:hypothetical protein [Brachybacterium sp. SW0106-09]GAP78545.1 hypothetical protein Y09_1374 [Brachybacterium sp. SW0106-09]